MISASERTEHEGIRDPDDLPERSERRDSGTASPSPTEASHVTVRGLTFSAGPLPVRGAQLW